MGNALTQIILFVNGTLINMSLVATGGAWDKYQYQFLIF